MLSFCSFFLRSGFCSCHHFRSIIVSEFSVFRDSALVLPVFCCLPSTFVMGKPKKGKVGKFNETKIEDIKLVYKYFKNENQKKGLANNDNVLFLKTAKALNVSMRSVKRYLLSCEFDAPGTSREIGKRKRKLDEFDKQQIRCTVNALYRQRQLPTTTNILKALNPDITLSKSCLRLTLLELGFRFRKSEDDRKIVFERRQVILSRIEFLRKIRKYREDGLDVVYLDETWVNQNHHKAYGWLPNLKPFGEDIGEDKCPLPNIPSGKGKRLIILHAGSENEGFIENCDLTFVAKEKDGDYHREMNSAVFIEWFEHTLCKALKTPSVIVLDNASYHNVKSPCSWYPTMKEKKQVLLDWLSEKGIPHDPTRTKLELSEIAKSKSPPITYMTDVIAGEHGHQVLRTPVRHCILNPIELIWAQVKGYVAQHNNTFKLSDVKKLVHQAFAKVTKTDWQKAVRHVIGIENDFWIADNIHEDIPPVIISFDSDESDEIGGCCSIWYF